MPTPPFLLSLAQMRRLSPHFPLSHGKPRADDRRVLSGIIYVIRHGCSGAMPLPPTARTKPSTTASSAGAASGCSTASLPPSPGSMTLEVIEAAELLPIRALQPALTHLFARQVAAVLQVGKSHHQPRRLARTPEGFVIQQPDSLSKLSQSTSPAKRISGCFRSSWFDSRARNTSSDGACFGFSRAHRKSPKIATPNRACRQFIFYRQRKNLLSLYGLGVLQGRLWQSHTCAGLRLVRDCYNSPHLRVTVLPAAVVAWE